MKARVPRTALAEAAAQAARHLPSRPSMPVYAALRLTVRDGRLEVAGFDGTTSVRHYAEAEVLEPGYTIVPGALLADITGTMRGESAELTLAPAGLQIECGNSSYQLATLEHEDYPTLPVRPTSAGTVDAGELLAAVTALVPATNATDSEAMPALAGIRVTAEDGELTLAATDRYRVGWAVTGWFAETPGTFSALVPGHQLHAAARAAAASGTRASIAFPVGPHGRFAVGSGESWADMALINARFPNVEMVIPPEFEATVDADAQELGNAVRRMARVAGDSTPVRLEAHPDHIVISAGNGATVRGREQIDAVLEGPERLRLAFAPRWLADGLTPFPGTVQLAIASWVTPVLLTDPDGEAPFRYLITPRRDDWAKPSAA